MTTCRECGYDDEKLAVSEVSEQLRRFGSRYRNALSGADTAAVTVRPNPGTWRALEYVCHVRDVFLVQRERVVIAQVEEFPSFARMHRDERVALCGYGDQSVPSAVAELEMAAELSARAFEHIPAPAWRRQFLYNWPSPAEHDLAWLGRHTVHEGEHHLMDVNRVLRSIRSPG